MTGQLHGDPAAAADQPGGGAEQSQPESFGFPPAGLVVGEGEQLHPGDELTGERDHGAPELVLGEAVQRQVGQAGVLGGADPVLGPGAAAVPQLQVSELALRGVGGEGGYPVSLRVGEPQLRTWVRAFLAEGVSNGLCKRSCG